MTNDPGDPVLAMFGPSTPDEMYAADLAYCLDFTVTDVHLAMVRRLCLRWNGPLDEYCWGAPAVSRNRPYGDSDVFGNIAELADREAWSDARECDRETWAAYAAAREPQFRRLHVEMVIVLQIVLETGGFRAGRYVRPSVLYSWQFAPENSDVDGSPVTTTGRVTDRYGGILDAGTSHGLVTVGGQAIPIAEARKLPALIARACDDAAAWQAAQPQTLLPVESDTPEEAYQRAVRYHRHYHQQQVNGVPPAPIQVCDEAPCRLAVVNLTVELDRTRGAVSVEPSAEMLEYIADLKTRVAALRTKDGSDG